MTTHILPVQCASVFPVGRAALIALILLLSDHPGTASESSSASDRSNPARTESEQDALLGQLTKLLTYGETHSYAEPNKRDAVVALGLLGDSRAVPVLVEHLENTPNVELRMQIVKSLGWLKNAEAVPVLEKTLTDKYPHIRRQSAIALKTITGRDYEYDRTGFPDPERLIRRTRIHSEELPPPSAP